jgi:putative NADPH-quinone reductase
MKVLLVVAHPCADSYTHACASAATAGLARAGHTVDLIDLYEERFRPAMSLAERLAYDTDEPILDPVIADHAARLKRTDAVVFAYPTWWSGLPAMLKGWLERVFVPHETFALRDAPNPIAGRLTNIRLLGGIATYGAPWWWIRLVVRDPGRAVVMKGLRPLCANHCRSFWLGLYRMDRGDETRRRAFLDRVGALAARL